MRENIAALAPTPRAKVSITPVVKAEWGASENNRRARYYTLTASGQQHLAAERKEFERIVGAIRLVLANA